MIFRLLIATVVLAPLPFASVYPWSVALMAIAVGALLVAWSSLLVLGKTRLSFGLRSTWLFLLLFLIPILWAVLQSSSATPLAWHHPLWQSAASTLGQGSSGSVSLDADNTIFSMMRLLAYGGIFWLALQYGRDPGRARQVFFAVAMAGLVYSFYGLFIEFSGAQMILWYDKFAYKTDLTSTFVNRNSYATYAGLTLLCLSSLILNVITKLKDSGTMRHQLLQIMEAMTAKNCLLIVGWITVAMALISTHSRAGVMSTGLGVVALVMVMGLSRGLRARTALYLVAAVVLVGGVFFAVGGGKLDERLAATSAGSEERLLVYELTMDAVKAEPFLGTGYGSFEEVFRLYRNDGVTNFFLKAHNTYLENALELGIPAALALFGAFVAMLVLTFGGLRRRQHSVIYPCTGFAATVLVAAHSSVDFSLQIPAVAATYALIMGVACAQSWSGQKRRDTW